MACPSASTIVSSLLSSLVVVRSPVVGNTFPAISRAASISAQTFSVLIRSSGMFPPLLITEQSNTAARSLVSPALRDFGISGIGLCRETRYDRSLPRRGSGNEERRSDRADSQPGDDRFCPQHRSRGRADRHA